MGVVLEIREGAMAGKRVAVATGQTVTFGRAAGRAEFALPHDTFMSGVHFAVECKPGGCRVQDLKSSNGTFLNGARIQDAMLANGDEIKGGQTIFAVKIVADTKLASLMPPEEVVPPPASPPRSRAVEPVPASAPQSQPLASPPQPRAADPVPLSVQELRPHADAASLAEQRPRAFDPALPAVPESRPLAAEPVPPAILPVPRLVEEPKAAPPAHSANVGPPLSAGAPVVEGELPLAAMRTADVDREPADPRPVPDAAVGPPARKSEPAAEPAPRKLVGGPPPPPAGGLPPKLEPSAADFLPRAERAAKSALPPVKEPPRVHAIPSPPGVSAKAPLAGENAPRVGQLHGDDNPPGADARLPNSAANPPRVSGPPPGVAPYIAEKFVEHPGSRGAGSSRGAAFSVMGWSFPAAPAEWLVQEGFGLQQSGHEEFPSSVAATEELLGGITLPQFVESQISMLRGYLRDAKIEPTMPPRVGGADESMAMDVRHSTKDGRELVYRRIYARSGSSVGVLTVTTLAADLAQVLQSLQPLLDGAAFRATVNN